MFSTVGHIQQSYYSQMNFGFSLVMLALIIHFFFFIFISLSLFFLRPNTQYSLSLAVPLPCQSIEQRNRFAIYPVSQTIYPVYCKDNYACGKGFMYGRNYELVPPQIIIWLSLFQLRAKGCADTDLIYCMCVHNNTHLFEQFELKRFLLLLTMKRTLGGTRKKFVYENKLIDAKKCVVFALFCQFYSRSVRQSSVLALWFFIWILMLLHPYACASFDFTSTRIENIRKWNDLKINRFIWFEGSERERERENMQS